MEKVQCFISHCSDDKEVVQGVYSVLREYYGPNYEFFNTSQKENAIYAGEGRGPAIRKALNESEIMIAVITDSYLRSTICLSEISAFWFADKPIIPLVFSKYGVEFLKQLLGQSLIYINLYDRNTTKLKKRAEEMVRALDKVGFKTENPTEAMDAFDRIFREQNQADPTRCYIGSREEFDNINKYCNQFGVSKITNTSLSSDELISNLKKGKEIYIISTTGANLIQTLSAQFIPNALSRGVNIYVLIPNLKSGFIKDVAEMEAPNEVEEHEQRFAREFNGVVYNLKDCIRKAKKIDSGQMGKVYFGCSYTMLRQTITLAVNDDSIWGWMSVTLPPKRTVDGTPSFEFSGEHGTLSMANTVYGHVRQIVETAQRRGDFVDLAENESFMSFSSKADWASGISDCEKYWSDVRKQAVNNTLSKKGRHQLIEVAAQHPLQSNGEPEDEFAARLDRAAALYQELCKQDPGVKIYVPGSVHCFMGEPDICSLSCAGKKYLIQKGIPEDAILGEEENHKYKGDEGVYNTADECFVASQIFVNGNFRKLHCICSPNQLLRKKLFYMVFGVIPYFYTVSTDEMAHDDIYEIFHSIPNILLNDHDWQGPDSADGNRTRRERNPKYQ